MFFDGSSGSEEEVSERPVSAMSGLSIRKSEPDFENIEAESGAEEAEFQRKQLKRSSGSTGGSWMPWSWGAKAEEAQGDKEMGGTHGGEDKGRSSGVDA